MIYKVQSIEQALNDKTNEYWHNAKMAWKLCNGLQNVIDQLWESFYYEFMEISYQEAQDTETS